MKDPKKIICNLYFVLFVTYAALFLISLFVFPKLSGVPDIRFFENASAERAWIRETRNTFGPRTYAYFVEYFNIFVRTVCVVGIVHNLYSKKPIIQLKTKTKILVPLILLVLYIPCFVYTKYHAPHYWLYLSQIPWLLLSMVFPIWYFLRDKT